MKNLKYAVQADDKHSVTVKTWQDDEDHWHYDMSIDGVSRSHGNLGSDGKQEDDE